jgi:hypothetical protein
MISDSIDLYGDYVVFIDDNGNVKAHDYYHILTAHDIAKNYNTAVFDKYGEVVS